MQGNWGKLQGARKKCPVFSALAHLMFYGAFFAYRQFPAKKAFTTPSNWVRERRVGMPAISLLQTYYVHALLLWFLYEGERDSSFSSKRSLLFPRRKCALLQETKTWNLAKTLFENLLFGLNHVFAAERVSPPPFLPPNETPSSTLFLIQ